MAAIVNARDVLLQGATRLVPVTVGTSITWGGTVSGNVTGTIAGTSAATVRDGAANGTSALAGLGDKISKSATTVTGSGYQQQSSGYSSGTGYAYHDAGAIYKYGGETKLVIDLASGVFAFKGDISGCNGNFSGNVVTGGYVLATGGVSSGGNYASVIGAPTTSGRFGGYFVGNGTAGVLATSTSSTQFAFAAQANNGFRANLIYSGGICYGFHVDTGDNNAIGVYTRNTGGGYALVAEGPVNITSSLQCDSLRIDQPPSTGGATATFPGNNKPGGNTSCAWLSVNLNGTPYYIPVWQ